MVRDDHHRLAGPVQRPRQIEDVLRAAIVLAGRRFIKDQRLGLHGQNGGDDDAGPITFGQRQRVLTTRTQKAHRAQALRGAFLDLVGAVAELAERKGHFFFDAGAENLVIGVLRHVADTTRQIADLQLAEILIAGSQVARCRRQRAS